MFKLKVSKHQRARLKQALKVVDSKKYDYVLTDDPNQVEADKINIVFSLDNIAPVRKMLDAIVKGVDTYITGYDEIGQKSIEARQVHYFIVEADEVWAVLNAARFSVKMKLYELEALLEDKYFIRVSKYALVNVNKIDYIKPALNSKLTLIMKNKDDVEVNRHYYKKFKETLRI